MSPSHIPLLSDWVAAVHAGDGGAALVAADLLQDRDVTLPELLLWYAGPHEDDGGDPDWQRAEARRRILAAWLRCVEPERLTKLFDPVVPYFRWYLVEQVTLGVWAFSAARTHQAVRAVKARVLTLFPEVMLTRRVTGKSLQVKNRLSDVGPSDAYGMTPVDQKLESITLILDGCRRVVVTEACPVVRQRRDDERQQFVVEHDIPAPLWLSAENALAGQVMMEAPHNVQAGGMVYQGGQFVPGEQE